MNLSVIPEEKFKEWFVQVWTIPGASTSKHPASFPLELAERLVRMFSFVGDVVLDPFVGTGTTMVAAAKWGRNSIGVEIDPDFVSLAWERLKRETDPIISKPWQEWVKRTKPKFYVFWIMRRGARNTVDRILDKVTSILEYANGVSAVIYEEREGSYAYVFTGGRGISKVDELIEEICQEILS